MKKIITLLFVLILSLSYVNAGNESFYTNGAYDLERHKAYLMGTGYDNNGYNRDGYDTDGFDIDGESREDINVGIVNPDGNITTDGTVQGEYDANGFNKETGLDRDGYDTDGFDVDGESREDINVGIVNPDGNITTDGTVQGEYDTNGFNKETGLDRDGYDADGFDIDGESREDINVDIVNPDGDITTDGIVQGEGDETELGIDGNLNSNNFIDDDEIRKLGNKDIQKGLLGVSEETNIIKSDKENGLSVLSEIFKWIKDTLSSILILIGVGAFLFIGARLGMARGNPEEFKGAMMHLVYAVIGIFVVSLAWAAVTLVAGINL